MEAQRSTEKSTGVLEMSSDPFSVYSKKGAALRHLIKKDYCCLCDLFA